MCVLNSVLIEIDCMSDFVVMEYILYVVHIGYLYFLAFEWLDFLNIIFRTYNDIFIREIIKNIFHLDIIVNED